MSSLSLFFLLTSVCLLLLARRTKDFELLASGLASPAGSGSPAFSQANATCAKACANLRQFACTAHCSLEICRRHHHHHHHYPTLFAAYPPYTSLFVVNGIDVNVRYEASSYRIQPSVSIQPIQLFAKFRDTFTSGSSLLFENSRNDRRKYFQYTLRVNFVCYVIF